MFELNESLWRRKIECDRKSLRDLGEEINRQLACQRVRLHGKELLGTPRQLRRGRV